MSAPAPHTPPLETPVQLRITGWTLASLVLFVATAACSAEATPAPSPVFDMTPAGDPARLLAGEVYRTLDADWTRTPEAEALIALAREEGAVVWSGYDQAQGDAWCEGFTAEFGVACTGRGIGAGQLVTTLVTEAAAGAPVTDVVYLSMSQMAQVLDRGLAAPVDWGALGVEPGRVWSSNAAGAGAAGAVGDAVGVTQSQYAHFVNTDIIDAEDVPRTVLDWLDPRWEGLICAPDFLLRAGNGFMALYYDADEMVAFHRELIDAQDVVVTADCDPLIVSGERPLTYMGYGLPDELLDTGYIEPFWGPGMGVNLFSHSVLADAPHPNAARLFTAWATSIEGSRLSWEAIGQGWAAFGHGPAELVSGRFADLELVYESPATFQERGERTRYFQEQLFGPGR